MNPSPEKRALSPEGDLVDAVTRFLAERGYRVRIEVPNMGQSADIVATRGRWVTFVEVKVRDWRRALQQCRAHQLVADFICIAVGTKSVSSNLQYEIESMGYGLIHYMEDGRCRWVIEPKRNGNYWRPQRRRLAGFLRTISYVD